MASNHSLHIEHQASPEDAEADTSFTSQDPSEPQPQNRQRTVTIESNDLAVEQEDSTKALLLGCKLLLGSVFGVIVLGSSVLSKLTLVSLTDYLRHYSGILINSSSNVTTRASETEEVNSAKVAIVYWQLLLILLVPNVLTFLRCLFFGALGKTKQSYPWPRLRSLAIILVTVPIEVTAMSSLVFLALPELPPGMAILVLCGVFIVQTIIDAASAWKKRCQKCERRLEARRHPDRQQYDPLIEADDKEKKPVVEQRVPAKPSRTVKVLKFMLSISESYIVKTLAAMLQIVGVLGLAAFFVYMVVANPEVGYVDYIFVYPVISLPCILLALSLIWSNQFQEVLAMSGLRTSDATARYKSSLISSGLRLILYPFITYVMFRYVASFGVDPWCLDTDCSVSLSGETCGVMIAHIVAGLVGYAVIWVSCTMTLSQLSVGIPLLLSTPVAVGICYAFDHYSIRPFFHFHYDRSQFYPQYLPYVPIWICLLWLGEIFAVGMYICIKTNIILAKDEDMFLMPHYNSVFLEQHTILNRQVKKGKKKKTEEEEPVMPSKNARTIFICSTMYRESDYEMKQMLKSILLVSQHYTKEYGKDEDKCDKFESHIFFDGAVNADQIENFGLQLLSLLEDTLEVHLNNAIKSQTPYGYRLFWMINARMPFYIHFKDKTKVKAKKRWSQVMYMSYVLNHRIKTDKLNAKDTFILTTDADIDFKANSVVVLLDMLEPNTNVAAVCARTHPKGQGLMYWYQLFDYAIGHWFQKPAEHILGSVLCSPGCFSVFRCSALKEVLEEYSSEVTGASEFLMKDMGEDRWLCSLLIKKGLRLEYCAISEDETYCPTEFNEYFKQRRRWIPSTVANLVMLISESGIITKGNDSISILYILFQVIMVFSTAISPATVILVIAAGLEIFGIPYEATVTVLSVLSIAYGLICLYASPKAQLDVSKLLTFVFGVIMSLVIVGIFKDIIDAIIGDQDKLPIGPPLSCENFEKGTEEYYDCLKSQAFADNFTNGINHHFEMPITATVIYMGALAGTFFIAALLHLTEIHCLLHSIWFLLGLPAGYLLLLIYSAANLCDRSWGTRESASGEDEGLWGWRKYLFKAWNVIASSWCCVYCCFTGQGQGVTKTGEEVVAERDKEENVPKGESESSDSGSLGSDERAGEDEQLFTESSEIEHVEMDKETEEWLIAQECQCYLESFAANGYKKLTFLAAMTMEDFEEVGVKKRGLRLRLEKAVKDLPSVQYERGDHDVESWLKSLELEEYTEVFHGDGYKWRRDIGNLKQLDQKKLKMMGIVRKAHLQRLLQGLEYLKNPPSVMDEETKVWLANNDAKEYAEALTAHGYTNTKFLAGIKAKDLEEIGVDKKGFRQKLEKAAQGLVPLTIKVDVPKDVQSWLESLELTEYTDLLHREGYRTKADMVNLKDLNKKQLMDMGITKTAHLKRLEVAIASLQLPTQLDENKMRTKGIVDMMPNVTLVQLEVNFWNKLIKDKLKPVELKFTHSKNVQKSLESLRNSTLAVLLLVNLMWIVLLSSLTFWQLQQYGIDPRAFQLLFLAVYGVIIIIQFFTMLAHRAVTLIHYLGRVRPREVSVTNLTRGYGYKSDFALVELV